jgi:hydroxymethylbilane synthase
VTAPLRLATRGSRLARWQAAWVAARVDGPAELVIVDTAGDRRTDVPLSSIGGQGVFVKEVQAAVLSGAADAAVHSAKDLPGETPAGLLLAAIGEREDPRDALVGARLDDIPRGGVVATGAARRRALLASRRPDLRFAELRGNIATRLDKADGFDAIVMAMAALRRLSLEDRVAEALDPSWFVPQVGQGTIAVECRADDTSTRARLAGVEDAATRVAVTAERAFLATLGGGCTLPVGAYAVVDEASGAITLHAVLAPSEQGPVLRRTASGDDPVALGAAVASALLADAPAAG